MELLQRRHSPFFRSRNSCPPQPQSCVNSQVRLSPSNRLERESATQRPAIRYLLVDHAVPAMWRSLAEVERGLTVRERARHARAPPDLAQDALEGVVGANPPPVLLREGVVGERLLDRRFPQLGGPGEAQATQLLDHSDSLLARCRDVLACVGCLEHGRNLPHLGARIRWVLLRNMFRRWARPPIARPW